GNLRRDLDSNVVTDDLIAYQLERLAWLRLKEIEQDTPFPTINLAVRAVDALVRHRDELKRQAARAGENDDAPLVMTDDDFHDFLDLTLNRIAREDGYISEESTEATNGLLTALGLQFI